MEEITEEASSLCSSSGTDVDKPKLVATDSLLVNFLPYNVTKKSHHIEHDMDKRTLAVREHLKEKLKETDPKTEKVKTTIELQLEKTEEKLTDLLKFGEELVNNIKAYNERQEVVQMQNKKRREKELQITVEEEVERSLSQLEFINDKWKDILELKEPMMVHERIKKQKEAIAELLASKDEMIQRCQDELKRTNEKYLLNQTNQCADICFLVNRIDNQIEMMKEVYKENINELIETIENERQQFQTDNSEKWNTLYEEITITEGRKSKMAVDKQKFYTSELQKIWHKQEGITRATKMRLEKDYEQLVLEIRKTRANVLLNSEKIDYNYQVLQRRNEENIIISNQQKRRVAKILETVTAMKRRLGQIKRSNRSIMNQLSEDIHKLHGSISELQVKLDYFRKDNRRKFNKVWEINFQEIKDSFCNIMEIDRILYEQQLAAEWQKPNLDFEALDLLKSPPRCSKSAETIEQPRRKQPKRKPLDYDHLHDILKKVSDRAGFLVEARLLEILQPYSERDKCLVRIENIFAALHVTDINMIEELVKHFEPYSYCPNCSNGLPASLLKTLYSLKPDTLNQLESQENEKLKEPKDCPNHYLVMEPALVLTSLNEYTTKQIKERAVQEKKKVVCRQRDTTHLLQMEKEEIESYWRQFDYYLARDKQNVWKCIEHGLNHYLEVLKKRQELDTECIFLENQNSELKFLLQKL